MASNKKTRNHDRTRRAEWARRIAADQRRAAQRLAAALRSITSRIRSIQVGGRTRLDTVGSLQGAGVVTAVLPNGRRTRMRIVPTLAPAREVSRLRSVVIVNERRQAAATRRNSRAVSALAAAQAAAVRKLVAQQIESDKQLRRRIVEADDRLNRRIARELRA